MNQAIRTSTNGYTRPWTSEGRRAWLESHTNARPLVVAESDGVVVGWAELSPYRAGRAAFRHTAEVTYYVHEAHRRRGVATALVEHLVAAAPEAGVRTLVAILLERNAPSVALLEKLGFERWGRLPGVAEIEGSDVSHVYYGKKLAR